ncbi:site-specific integrase [candidate division KSB1 bacterium]|nr:site-specific integrase [candidate division KSB1 bacterium]RQW05720.1 MAG: site-specific integrase [candidate division KSB1 bacterium]
MPVYKKVRKDGTSAWYYDFCYRGQRYRAVGGTTKTQALRIQEKVRSMVMLGEYGLVAQVKDPKFEDFAVTYLQRRQHLRSQKRDNLSVRTLTPFFRGRTLKRISAGDIEDYISKRLAEGRAPATVNRELTCLKRMYNLAIKWKEATYNPVNDVDFLEEPPGRTRYLSEEEAQRLIDSAIDHLKPIIITALNTGMRLGEILNLKWQQVHIERVLDPYIEVENTKNNKKRNIPLNDDMVVLLDSIAHKEDDFVFHGLFGDPVKYIKVPWRTALKRANIKDFRFHDLRHTFASHFIMKGGDAMTLKEILGHSSLKMVERYTHLASSHKRRQVNNLNGAFTIRHLYATSAAKAMNDGQQTSLSS